MSFLLSKMLFIYKTLLIPESDVHKNRVLGAFE